MTIKPNYELEKSTNTNYIEYICGSSEKERFKFFSSQRQRVRSLMEKTQNYSLKHKMLEVSPAI